MAFNRRSFLMSAAASSIGLSLARPTLADLYIGSGALTTVSDGSVLLPGSFIFEPMPQQELKPLLAEFSQSGERLTPECNLNME